MPVDIDMSSNLTKVLAEIVRCPACLKQGLRLQTADIICPNCSATFNVDRSLGVASLLTPIETSDPKTNIQAWWGDLYQQAYNGHEDGLNSAQFLDLLAEVEDLFRHRDHLAVCEMPLDQLSGKRILEIGSGSGAHSAFSKNTARLLYR